MPQLNPLPKFILIAVVIGGLFYGVNYLATKGFLGSSAEKMSSVLSASICLAVRPA